MNANLTVDHFLQEMKENQEYAKQFGCSAEMLEMIEANLTDISSSISAIASAQ